MRQCAFLAEASSTRREWQDAIPIPSAPTSGYATFGRVKHGTSVIDRDGWQSGDPDLRRCGVTTRTEAAGIGSDEFGSNARGNGMAIERDPRGIGHLQGRAYDPGDPRAYAAPPSALQRFLGGSPFSVFVRLLLLSVLVGAGMALFGITPGELFWRGYDMARVLIDHGFDTFREFGKWILAGAMIVVPLWLLSRFLTFNRR